LLEQKDKQLEEKNKIIFMLNRQIGELESKLSNMIALPDYTKEKEELVHEKEKVEIEKKNLEEQVVSLRVINWALTFLLVLLIVAGIFWLKGG